MPDNCIFEDCSCPSPDTPCQSGFRSFSSSPLVLLEILAVSTKTNHFLKSVMGNSQTTLELNN